MRSCSDAKQSPEFDPEESHEDLDSEEQSDFDNSGESNGNAREHYESVGYGS